MCSRDRLRRASSWSPLRRTALAAAEADPDRRIEPWSMDGARVGQKGRVGFRWWAGGERPRGLRQPGCEWVHLFGAVRPATGDGFAPVLPEVSVVAMQAFLDRFAAGLAEGVLAVLVLHQPGWHGSRRLVFPPDVTLVSPPPYAPEFEPVGRVWLSLRERFLAHRLFDGYRVVVAACCGAWRALTPERLRSLSAYP